MSEKSRARKIIAISLWIISIALACMLIGMSILFWSLQTTASRASEVSFVVEDGWGVRRIGESLEQEGIISSRWIFIAAVVMEGSQHSLKAGTYIVPQTASVKELVDVFSGGEVDEETTIKILEGWSNVDIAEYLESKGLISRKDFLAAANTIDSRQLLPDSIFPSLAGKSGDVGLEGYLYPDTYRVFRDATSRDIIKKMLENFEKKLTQEDRDAIAAQNKSIFEVLTLASIVEQEEKKAKDKPIVAGVFLQRLAIGMPLQSDATVNYVTGKDLRSPTFDDLKVDSLYNTYKYPGLPPGPICNPSIESIRAVIHPQASEYLYFLHPLSGETIYGRTLDEHNQNKQKYLK